MNYLLDTHTLIWTLMDSPELKPQCRDILASAQTVIFVSMASLWELQIKESIGKITLPPHFLSTVSQAGFEILNLQIKHLETLSKLPMHHRDPFDRILIAQATHEALTLMTRDSDILKYDINCFKV